MDTRADGAGKGGAALSVRLDAPRAVLQGMTRGRRWLAGVLIALLVLAALAVRFGPNVARLFEPVTDVFPAADAGADEPY